jgi:uncharacterized protein YdhG (YjbR/CyaY superfamily)
MVTAAKRGSSKAGDSAAKAIESYFAKAPEPARNMLAQIRELVWSIIPAEAEEIFSYGIPGFQYKGRLLWYGAFKKHCGFYPGSPPLLQSLAEELKGFKTARGSVQLPLDKPLPVALVKKIVRLRVAENEARSRKR